MVKKWSKGVDIEEGALTKLGWPNYGKIASKVAGGSAEYSKVVHELSYLANISKHKPTVQKARAMMVRLKKQFRPEGKKPGSPPKKK